MGRAQHPTSQVWRGSHAPRLFVDLPSCKVVDANRDAEAFWGYSFSELVGKDLAELIDSASVEAFRESAHKAQRAFSLPNLTMVQRNGAEHRVILRADRPAAESRPRIWACHWSEAGRRSAAKELGRLNWALAAYARSASALVRSQDVRTQTARICAAIAEEESYALACIGLLSPPGGEWLEFVATAGRASEYVRGLRLTKSDELVEGWGPTGRTLRNGVPQLSRDTLTDPIFEPWRERAKTYGLRSTVTVPIRVGSVIIGALVVYSSEPDAFGPRELNLFQQLSEEVGFALAVAENQKHLLSAEKARLAAEERAHSLQNELQRAARLSLMGEFSAALTHEINQPLAATELNAETALRWLNHEPPRNSEARDALVRIRRDIGRVNEIVARTRSLYMSRETIFTAFDLNAAIDEVLAMTREHRRRSDVELTFERREGLSPIWGDRTQIQQVIFNLVVNGLEALETIAERRRRIHIETSVGADLRVHLQVEDNGPGFPPGGVDRVFERFFTTKAGGTGLGLAISRRIVEAHGGSLWAEMAEPHGARFYLALPLTQDAGK